MSGSDRMGAPPTPPSTAPISPDAEQRRGWLARLNPLHLFTHEQELTPLSEARRLMQEQQYGQASLMFRQILEQTPEEPEALRGLSGILLRKGGRKSLMEALARMETAARAAPADPANYLMTTLIYSRLGRPYEAGLERKKMAVARTLQKNPDNAAANNSMGVILLRVGRHDAAIVCFKKAVTVNARYEQAHRNLAKTYFVLARREPEGAKRDEMIRNAQQAVQTALNIQISAASLITEARVLTLQGNAAAAEERLVHATRLEPHHPELAEAWRMIPRAADVAS